MSDTVNKIIIGTFLIAAAVIILRDSDATNKIIRAGAEGYGDIVRALKSA